VLGKAFDEAVAAERYDVARQVGKLAEASALKTRVAAAREEVDEKLTHLKQLEADYAKVKDALAVLETEPADPDANLAVGKYRCFVRGDWDGGLSNLALGGDATLKTLAEQELAQPDTAADQVKLADGWWELAEKHSGATKTQMQLRSRRWYEKAAPNLAGLAEVKVTKRLEQLAASERPDTGRTKLKETRPVNLLALIDVKRDAVVGTWRIWNDTLMSPKQGGARIQIPYVPPANYDLVVEVTRLDGVDSFNVALVGGGKQFAAYIDGWRSKASGLGLVDGKQPNNNPTRYSGRILTNGRKGTLVFSVREAGVQVSANGKTIVSWAEGFDRLSRDGDWTGPRTDCLLVGANKSVFQVHRMTLIPVTSPGRRKQ
jgi:hypothetical protein